jgi:aquaporin Z
MRAARLLTEFVGTLVFLSVIGLSSNAGSLAPLAIGATLMSMVYMGGHVSGGHYNPAVSLAIFLRRKIGAADFVLYVIVQVVAAVVAFSIAFWVSGSTPGIHPGPKVGPASALAVEVMFTSALVLVVLNVAGTRATQGNSFYGLAIGFTVGAGALVAGPISGGAFNPAVGVAATFAGAIFGTGGWGDVWLYLAGPMAGAVLGAGIHAFQQSASGNANLPDDPAAAAAGTEAKE